VAAELVNLEGCMLNKLNYEICKKKKHIYSWRTEDEPLLIKLYYMLFYTIRESLLESSFHRIENTVFGIRYMFQRFMGVVLKATGCRAFTTSLERLSAA